MKSTMRLAVTLILSLLLSSCAMNTAYRQGKHEEKQGNWDKAVVLYTRAKEADPESAEIRLRLEMTKRMAAQDHLRAGRRLWSEEKWEDALLEYRTAVELDPLNRAALFEFRQNLDKLDKMLAEARKQEEWERLRAEERSMLEERAEEKPCIDIDSNRPQSFVFPDRQVGEIYQALAKMAGINIIFHETARQKLKQKTDFIINNATFWEAFDYFVLSNNHFYRTINEDTILIIDGSPNNRRNFEDKAVKIFYLGSAEARDIGLMLRQVLRITTVNILKKQNAIVVRESPQKLALIARMISMLDKPKAEVIVDVEILEVDSSLIHNVGALLSNYATTQRFINPEVAVGTGDTATTSVLRMDNLSLYNKTNLFLSIPDVAYHFLKTQSHSKLLAKPQMRITDSEKSVLHIGEKWPVRSTTFNPGQASGIGTPVNNYTYEDVGIKFTITPKVHHNNDISLELDIEISSIGAGPTADNPSFTTRTVKGMIRLKDGETNLLAGLIREEEKIDQRGIAGLADIPIIGKLFSKHDFDRKTTDIIITLTPHIVRGTMITEADLQAILVGPEINTGYEGLVSMEQIYNMRFLRGVPLSVKGAGRGARVEYYDDYSDEDWVDEEEDWEDEEPEEEEDEPPYQL